VLSGGAQPSNVFWAAEGQVTLGASSVFNGIILGATGIAIQTGATLHGKALAQTAVTLDGVTLDLASSNVPVITTTQAQGSPQSPVFLATACKFSILAKAGISTTGVTRIQGDIGVSPIAATAMTGFALALDASTTFSHSSLVSGRCFAADYSPPTPTYMATAVTDMESAHVDAANRANPDHTELGAGILSGMTLAPGLYKWSSTVTIPTDLTLVGDSNAVWIFQIAQTLNIATGKHVVLSGGAQAKNVFWVVEGQVTLGVSSVFNGIILGMTGIAIQTSATLHGKALAQTAVTLDAVSLDSVDCSAPSALIQTPVSGAPLLFTSSIFATLLGMASIAAVFALLL
jgi:hypothetical protein